MKTGFVFLLIFLLLSGKAAQAQKIDSIFVHLYTDSLKKGTYNYINIDGLLSSGKYIPLDTSQLSFSSSYGKFFGNSLFIDHDCKEEKVSIHVVLNNNKQVKKDFVMYIKKKEDPQLKTEKQVMDELRSKH